MNDQKSCQPSQPVPQISVKQEEGYMHLVKKYGAVGVATHLSISWTTFGLIYLGVKKSGQGPKILQFFRLDKKISPGAGDFGVSALLYKTTIPPRFALSLIAIPFIYNYFYPQASGTSVNSTTTLPGLNETQSQK